MHEVISSSMLEHQSSTFVVDLMKTEKGTRYINVTQTVERPEQLPLRQEIKIHSAVLDDFIRVLNAVAKEIPEAQLLSRKPISQEQRNEIQNRYLKGVSIRDLTVQFDVPVQMIEEVLREKRIPITYEDQVHPLRVKRGRR